VVLGGEKKLVVDVSQVQMKVYMRRQTNTIYGTSLPLAQGIRFDLCTKTAIWLCNFFAYSDWSGLIKRRRQCLKQTDCLNGQIQLYFVI
jgi:hypothetical protein